MNLILLYTNKNRYSMNALLGAMESFSILDKINILFAKNFTEINSYIDENPSMSIIAISFFTEQKKEIYQLIKQIKEKYKNKTIIICGGPHSSALPQEVLLSGADYVIKGEGEKKFLEFIESALNGKWLKEKIIEENSEINLNEYLSFSKRYLKFGPIEITRGCPYACKFCQTSFLFGCKPRHRDISHIVNQVKEMVKIGLDDIRFITPNAMSYGSDGKNKNLKIVEEMLSEVKKCLNPNGRIFFGTFPSEIRPEDINEDSLNILKKYVYNKKITIGIQSASDRLLKKINRGHTVEDAKNAVELSLKNGFIPVLDFIFGLPEENYEDILLTMEFIDKYSKKGAIIHTHTFMPLPGTPYSKAKIGEIPQELKLKIKHLENKKLAFGKWEKFIDCSC